MIKIEKNNMIENLFDYNCPVNNILKEIDKIGESNHEKRIPDNNFIIKIGNEKTQNRRHATKVENIVYDFDKELKYINIYDCNEEEKILYYNFLYEEYIDKLRGMSISKDTISLLITRTLSRNNNYTKNNCKIKTKLINMLYRYNKHKLLECFC